ncbi:MAG: hypothetical protein Q8K70_03190 [Bacteroidota bacterium]|nr:hypothetical protein [Bacteroidota bacterium]
MNKLITSFLMFLVVLTSSCTKNNVNPDPILEVPVSITINMALPQYEHLQFQGSFVYEQGGVKGIVVVHHSDDQYYAFDRSCSYQPNNQCSKLEVDSSILLFRCGETVNNSFVKCCDSRFSFDGSVFNGPSVFGLKHYNVSKSGNLLNIKN